MVHKLVGKIIRFGRNADGNVVSAGGLGEGHEIGHRLTDARARLDHAMGARDQRIANLNRHRDLLVARLIGGVHAIDQAAGGESASISSRLGILRTGSSSASTRSSARSALSTSARAALSENIEPGSVQPKRKNGAI